MGVLLVHQKGRTGLCCVLEESEGMSHEDSLKCWCASMGMSEEGYRNFYMDHCPVIAAKSLSLFMSEVIQ